MLTQSHQAKTERGLGKASKLFPLYCHCTPVPLKLLMRAGDTPMALRWGYVNSRRRARLQLCGSAGGISVLWDI